MTQIVQKTFKTLIILEISSNVKYQNETRSQNLHWFCGININAC